MLNARIYRLLGLLLLALAPLTSPATAQNSAPSADGQTAAAPYVPTMTFDVASVRESKASMVGGFTMSGGFEPPSSSHLMLVNWDFRNILVMAFPVQYSRTIGMDQLPDKLKMALFNVQAKADEATEERLAKLSNEQSWLERQHMVQAMLVERFNLKFHWETRDAEAYDLVVSKPGKLQSTGASLSAEEKKTWGDGAPPPIYQKGGANGYDFIGHGATMGILASIMEGQFGAPVYDKTGLTGKYDFDLKYFQTWESDRRDNETNPLQPLQIAIQDQLGLKLVRSHGPVKFLVIDHAEMLTPN